MALFRLTIRKKLIFVVICVAAIAFLVLGLLTYRISRNALQSCVIKKLTAIRESKKAEIENYLDALKVQVLSLSESTMTIAALKQFKKEFYALAPEAPALKERLAAHTVNLKKFYQEQFIPHLRTTSTAKTAVEEIFPKSPLTIWLQSLYIADNPNPIGKKNLYTKAPDGSQYSAVHAYYDPVFNNICERFEYEDMFLVDIETGYVLFSTAKEIDFAANIIEGSLRNTTINKVLKACQQTADENFVTIIDFDFYEPAYGAPCAFVGTPIFEEGKKIGALIFQLPIDFVNKIMTYDKKWAENGLGVTGETILIGKDLRLRSIARAFIEDPNGYLENLRKIGVQETVIDKIKTYSTTILFQTIDTTPSREIARGNTNTQIVQDYREIPVLAAYSPLQVEDITWGIIAKIDQSEAFEDAYQLGRAMIIGIIFLLLLLIGMIFLCVQVLFVPISKMLAVAQTMVPAEKIDLSVTFPVMTEDEFGDLALYFNNFIHTLTITIKRVKETVATLNMVTSQIKQVTIDLADVDIKTAEKIDASHVMSDEEGDLAKQRHVVAEALSESMKKLGSGHIRVQEAIHRGSVLADALLKKVICCQVDVQKIVQQLAQLFGAIQHTVYGINALMQDAHGIKNETDRVVLKAAKNLSLTTHAVGSVGMLNSVLESMKEIVRHINSFTTASIVVTKVYDDTSALTTSFDAVVSELKEIIVTSSGRIDTAEVIVKKVQDIVETLSYEIRQSADLIAIVHAHDEQLVQKLKAQQDSSDALVLLIKETSAIGQAHLGLAQELIRDCTGLVDLFHDMDQSGSVSQDLLTLCDQLMKKRYDIDGKIDQAVAQRTLIYKQLSALGKLTKESVMQLTGCIEHIQSAENTLTEQLEQFKL